MLHLNGSSKTRYRIPLAVQQEILMVIQLLQIDIVPLALMNRFKGNISSIEVQGALRLYQVDLGATTFSAIVISGNSRLEAMGLGDEISVVFKETEVVIGKEAPKVSLQNRIEGTIISIQIESVLSKLSLNTAIGRLEAIITSNAVKQLQLEKGSLVNAMIKTNEVMLAP